MFFYYDFLVMMMKMIFISSTDRDNGTSFYFFLIGPFCPFFYIIAQPLFSMLGKSAGCLQGHSDVRVYSLELESITSHTKSFSWYGRNVGKLDI